MFKHRKIILCVLCTLYIIFTCLELVKYMNFYSNVFGMIYLLISVFIIFLFVPLVINYKRKYSLSRVSKLFLIISLGLFSSFVLPNIKNYIDLSKQYILNIKIYIYYLKPCIYLLLLIIILLEIKITKIIKNIAFIK